MVFDRGKWIYVFDVNTRGKKINILPWTSFNAFYILHNRSSMLCNDFKIKKFRFLRNILFQNDIWEKPRMTPFWLFLAQYDRKWEVFRYLTNNINIRKYQLLHRFCLLFINIVIVEWSEMNAKKVWTLCNRVLQFFSNMGTIIAHGVTANNQIFNV